MYQVLIVDDDRSTRYMLKRYKEWAAQGFALAGEACDGKEALQKLKSGHFDLVITDIKMPGMNGIEFMQELKSMNWQTCVIFLSTHSDFEYAKQGIRLGVFDYMTKPLSDDLLGESLARAKKYLDAEYRKRAEQPYYPREREKKLTACILSGGPINKAEIAGALAEIAAVFEHDLRKTGLLLNMLLANINEKVYAAFPGLQNIEGAALPRDLSEAASFAELNEKFLHFVRGSLAIVKKYELHHADSVIRRICSYVLEHVEEDIRLEIIAGQVHMSRDYIGKLFKHKTGCNFNDFVTRVKMEHAKYLFQSGDLKNYEVSEKLGYSKPDYFSRLFKNHTGHTPSEFKKMHNINN